MPTIREKRVYDEATTPTPVFVAAEQGLVVARISADKVGEFGLERRCTARDVAVGADGTLALATDEATLVASRGSERSENRDASGDQPRAEADPEQFRETGFGPATAVAVVEGQGRALVAADESGEISRLPITDDGSVGAESTDRESLGTVDDVRALHGRLVAAADGVHRVTDTGLVDAGLDDARDVAARGAPLAATVAGLYELGNGWMVASEDPFETVATDGDRGHAVTADGTVLAREKGGGEWSELALPAGDPIADFAYTDDAVVAATVSGSLLVDAGEGWRSRRIGVTGVQATVAAPRPGEE